MRATWVQQTNVRTSSSPHLLGQQELRLQLGVDQVEDVEHRGVVHLEGRQLRPCLGVLTSQDMSSWIFFLVASLVRKSFRIEMVDMLSDLKRA